jgi:hypothetical protein
VEAVRDFLNTGKGKAVTYAGVAAAAIVLLLVLRSMLGDSEAAAQSKNRIFIDAETRKPFEHELQVGETIPTMAPSGKKTGFPAELCYWTADGKIKDKPTPVLLNRYIGARNLPTFCPDCGRLVVGHNPRPVKDDNPPPTEAQVQPH